ncbi:MAG: hypothetical protein U5N56_10925 [Candidatus Marinimicrobia bacterium]|nr:hypothetical protein [Candidatus Neomarinimicrobiota bacterium]
MKVNLLNDDQMSKVPHQDKDNNVMSFGDALSGGNDDFYFQQPPPHSEEYKRPRKFRFWLFFILLLLFLLIGAFISNPQGTKNFFAAIGNRTAEVWKNIFSTSQTSLQVPDSREMSFMQKDDEEKKDEDREEPVQEQRIITVEKPVVKEIVKVTTEEKVLKSPQLYENIRDELAVTKRNIDAAEFVWAKIPGGMILDRLNLSENEMSLSVRSRYPMLIESYSEIVENHNIFNSVLSEEPGTAEEMTTIRLIGELEAFKKEDRPERIWDLDVEWFDDYLDQVAERADANITQEITGTRTLNDAVLQHDIHLTVSGSRSSMMLFFQEIKDVPAAYTIRTITSNYYPGDELNILELDLAYYERK